MIINHILAASRIPYILESKGIEIDDNLLRINVGENKVEANIYHTRDIMKFDNWEFKPYKNETDRYVGELIVDFEGIKFTTCVRVDELPLLNLS